MSKTLSMHFLNAFTLAGSMWIKGSGAARQRGNWRPAEDKDGSLHTHTRLCPVILVY